MSPNPSYFILYFFIFGSGPYIQKRECQSQKVFLYVIDKKKCLAKWPFLSNGETFFSLHLMWCSFMLSSFSKWTSKCVSVKYSSEFFICNCLLKDGTGLKIILCGPWEQFMRREYLETVFVNCRFGMKGWTSAVKKYHCQNICWCILICVPKFYLYCLESVMCGCMWLQVDKACRGGPEHAWFVRNG